MCNKDCQQMYLENLKVFSYFFWYFENLSLLRINAAAPFEAVTRCHLVLVLHSFQIWGSKGQIHLFVLLLFLKYVFFLKTAAVFFHFAGHSQIWLKCFFFFKTAGVFFPSCCSFSNMAKVFFDSADFFAVRHKSHP